MQRIWLSSVLAIVFSGCTPSLQPIADIQGPARSAKLQLDIGTSQDPSLIRDLLQAELKQAAAQVYASIGSDLYGADLKAMRMGRLSRLVFERIGKPESLTQMMMLNYQLKLPSAFFGTNMITKLKE